MNMTIKVEGIEVLKKKLEGIRDKQTMYAAAVALTRTAQEIKTAEYAEMQKVFDRPTPWALNSLYIKPATKQSLESMVYFKDTSSNRSTTLPFLPPQIHGGERQMKRFEYLLNKAGVLPRGMYITPGAACPLDAYGNISKSFIIQIVSYFRAFTNVGHTANITDKKKQKLKMGNAKKGIRGYEYFVSYGKGTEEGRELLRSWPKSEQGPLKTIHLPAGIYKRTGFAWGSSIKPIFMFVRKPSYRQRFPFYDIAKTIARSKFKENFSIALREALRTAK